MESPYMSNTPQRVFSSMDIVNVIKNAPTYLVHECYFKNRDVLEPSESGGLSQSRDPAVWEL